MNGAIIFPSFISSGRCNFFIYLLINHMWESVRPVRFLFSDDDEVHPILTVIVLFYAPFYFIFKHKPVYECIFVRYRHKTITAVHPGSYHDIVCPCQIKIFALIGTHFFSKNENDNEQSGKNFDYL